MGVDGVDTAVDAFDVDFWNAVADLDGHALLLRACGEWEAQCKRNSEWTCDGP
jgi:hypothetical protein